jgi:hypothetical protein
MSRTKAARLTPNNEPMPPMHGAPHRCSSCGRRITSGPEGGRNPGEHLRRAGMPKVIEQRELRALGLVDPPGHYLPWWGVTFVCADCLERWRRTPLSPSD